MYCEVRLFAGIEVRSCQAERVRVGFGEGRRVRSGFVRLLSWDLGILGDVVVQERPALKAILR